MPEEVGQRELVSRDVAQSHEGPSANGGSTIGTVVPIALSLAAVDGPLPFGDALAIATLSIAAAYDLSIKTYVTYTLTNSEGKVYVGRASGYGTPYQVMMRRYYSHHMRALGYGNPTLDNRAQGYPVGYYAIRGREQMLVDHYGGIGSPKLGNAINPIWEYNPYRPTFILMSTLFFGPLK